MDFGPRVRRLLDIKRLMGGAIGLEITAHQRSAPSMRSTVGGKDTPNIFDRLIRWNAEARRRFGLGNRCGRRTRSSAVYRP